MSEPLESRTLLSVIPLSSSPVAVKDTDAFSYSTGNRSYYVRNNELISTDGTPQGTRIVPGTPATIGGYQGFLAAGGYLYFDGLDSSQNGALYRMNLASEQVSRISSTWQTLTWGNAIRDACVWNDTPYFLQRGPEGVGIYSVSNSGQYFRTASFAQLSFQVSIWGQMAALDDRLIVLFYGSTDNLTHLWTSNGTTAGTTRITAYGDVPLDNYGVSILEPLQDRAVFTLDRKLYRTDGTLAGTTLIQNMGSYYSVLASRDGSVAAVYPFDDGQYTKPLAYTDGDSLFTTTIIPGAKINHRDPVAGTDAVYVNSTTGVYELTLDGPTLLSGVNTLRNLSLIDSTPYFGTNRSIGRIQNGHAEHLFKSTTSGGNLDGNGFQKVPGGYTFWLGGTIYFAPFDLPTYPNLSGTLFHDENRNGIQDPGETHDINGINLHIDLDNDGIRDGNESNLPLDQGFPNFNIQAFDPGTITLRLNGFQTLFALWPDEELSLGLQMGQHTHVVIRYDLVHSRGGRVTKDLDLDDGIDVGEPGVPNVNVYADLNNNRAFDPEEPFDQTNGSGTYLIRDLPPGRFPLRVELPPAWFVTQPLLGAHNIDTTGNYVYQDTLHFGITDQIPNSYVIGTVFNDLDRDGIRDTGEPSFAPNFTWLDLDSDGVRDSGEPASNGSSFSFRTRQTDPMKLGYQLNGWVPTTNLNFELDPGERISLDLGLAMSQVQPGGAAGIVFNDLGNGQFNPPTDTPRSLVTVWLDLDNDMVLDTDEPRVLSDFQGAFTFNGLAAGRYTVRWFLPSSSHSPTTLGENFEPLTFEVVEGMATPAATNLLLGSIQLINANVPLAVQYFIDHNLNGVFDPSDSTRQSGTTNVIGYLDLNASGTFDSGDRSFSGTTTLNVAPNRYALRFTTTSGNYVMTTPGLLVEIVATRGTSVTLPSVGIAWPVAKVSNIVHQLDVGLAVVDFDLSVPLINPTEFANAVHLLAPDGSPVPVQLSLHTGLTYRIRLYGTALSDGLYSLRIAGYALAGTSIPAPPNVVIEVPVLRGDLDGSRRVDFNDLLVMAQNFGLSGRSYTQGNINRDSSGLVNFDDLLLLAQRYGTSLVSAAPVLGVSSKSRRATNDVLIE